ncbi:MAG: hypothetical protein BMS9Abin01_2134 [Gammaproteobacteria bacterium]|nr:MAG: hypothetical protein BMS9Abin01_2134 [Gammaproteobacteria bacterium]
MRKHPPANTAKQHFGPALRVLLILVLVTVGAFSYEYQQSRGGFRADGLIVERNRRPDGGGPFGDAYEIVIEYRVGDNVRRLSTSRPVWDSWGKMDTIGARVSVLYLDDGRAFVDTFAYLYPLTTMFLVLSTIATVALIWMRSFGRSRLKANTARADRFRQARKRPGKRLSKHRRQLLSRLNRWLVMAAVVIVLGIIGILGPNVWIVIASVGAIVILSVMLKNVLACPHCGASLKAELRDMVPHVGHKTNWLMVQNYLAKGVEITCRSCGSNLDGPG